MITGKLISEKPTVSNVNTVNPPSGAEEGITAVRKQRSVYDRLFEAIQKGSRRLWEKRVLSSVIGGGGSIIDIPVQNTIVTTNYDMSVELYHRLIQKPLADGFERTNDDYVKELDFRDYLQKGQTE